MSRKRKRFLRASLLAGAAVAVVYLVVLPMVARRQLARVLREAGLPNVTFEVSSAGLFQSEVRKLRAAESASLKALVIDYTLPGLSRGRISRLRVEGLEMLFDFKDGRVDLGVIDTILAHRNEVPAQPAPGGTSPLPLDRIEIADSTIIIKTPQEQLEIPVAGVLMVLPDGKLLFTVDAQSRAVPIHITGTIDPAKKILDLHANSGALDVPGVVSVMQGLLPKCDIRLSGNTAAEVRYLVDSKGSTLAARLEPKDLILRIPYGKKQVTKLQFEKGVLTVEALWRAGVAPSIKLTSADLSLASEANDARIDGMDASLAYGHDMESSPQSVKVRSAQVGKMQASDGSIAFRIDQQHVVRIDRSQWTWLGGTLSTARVQITPGQPTDLTVNGQGIDLKQLLEQVGTGRVSGEGRVDLNLPLRIDWPRLGFGRGSARNLGPGRLQIADAAKVAQAVPEAAGKRHGEQEKLKGEVIEALQDLDFDLLQLTLRPNDGSLSADAHLAGRGRKGARKAVDLEVHLSNVDDVIQFYLGIAGKLSGQ
jgi:hypothetical protein